MEQFNSDETPSDTPAGNGPAYTGIPPRNNEAALFVGGLSFSATEEDLRNAFGFVGNIVSVRIVQDRDTGKPRGFAFVNFESPESVDAAIRECQGMELCGRNVRLDRSAAGIVGRGFRGGKSTNYIPPGVHGMNYPVPHNSVPGDFYMYNRHLGTHPQQFMAVHGGPPTAFAYPGYHPYMQAPQGGTAPDATSATLHPPPPFMMGYPAMMVPPGGVPPPPPANAPNGHYTHQQAPPPPPPVPQNPAKGDGQGKTNSREADAN